MPDEKFALAAREKTPEMVAYDLMQIISHVEKKALHADAGDGWTSADRRWILDTYAECMLSVRSPRTRQNPNATE